MHVYFSGIGGAGIGPLALLSHEAGYTVSGSDKQDSDYLTYLAKHGVTGVHVGQTKAAIAAIHDKQPIDWFVYSSAVAMEKAGSAELEFCQDQGIKTSKRDEFTSFLLQEKHLQMIAIAGTHGKTTTTAMVIWLMKKLGQPISYTLAAKTSYGEMAEYDAKAPYFIYEADEFDRNFLAYKPKLSIITGVSWDHHEIYPRREDYQAAFQEFIGQSDRTVLWQEDFDYLGLEDHPANLLVEHSNNPLINLIQLKGRYNRLDAWLVIQAIHRLTKAPVADLISHMNDFPGLSRRMEQIIPNLYSDYAHTPEKVRGAMSAALEMAAEKNQAVIAVYEPLTNRRQHYMLDDYGDCFDGAAQVYWIPSYLAREDPKQRILTPVELISHLSNPEVAKPMERDKSLKTVIQQHLGKGDLVVCMAGGGGNSLDEWVRREFKPKTKKP